MPNNISAIQHNLAQAGRLHYAIPTTSVAFVYLSEQTNGVSGQVAKSHAAVRRRREEEEAIVLEKHLQVSHAIEVWLETAQQFWRLRGHSVIWLETIMLRVGGAEHRITSSMIWLECHYKKQNKKAFN